MKNIVSKVKLKYCLFLFLLILSTATVFAAQTPARKFNEEELNKERKDNSYDIYDQSPEQMSWYDRLVMQVNEWLAVLLRPLSKVQGWMIYTIAFILVAVLLFVVLNMTGNLPFGGQSAHADGGNASMQENIHEIDFAKEIQEALKQGDYRKAVRLYYLLSLKMLSDKKLIDWQAYKTNREYIRELRVENLKTKLEDVTFMFELVWYGEMDMDQRAFDEIFVEMQGFQQAIKNKV